MGIISFKNGDKYRGQFKDGRPCGFGIVKYQSSIAGSGGMEFEEAQYEGQFRAGKREGKGTMIWGDSSSFTGMWRDDMRSHGEMRFANGTIYRG